MPPKTTGRKKQNRNISGLRNQQKVSTGPSVSEDISCQLPHSAEPSEVECVDDDSEEDLKDLYFDSLKAIPADSDSDNESEDGIEEDWVDVGSVVLRDNLRGLVVKLDDRSDDEEWLPPILAAKRKRKRVTKCEAH